MKFKVIGFIFIFVCFSIAISVAKDKEIPPWMEEIRKNGKGVYLVPKGVKRRFVGPQVVVESPNEYVARRLYETEEYLENRFKKIEEYQKELREEFEKLKKIVEELKSEKESGESP